MSAAARNEPRCARCRRWLVFTNDPEVRKRFYGHPGKLLSRIGQSIGRSAIVPLPRFSADSRRPFALTGDHDVGPRILCDSKSIGEEEYRRGDSGNCYPVAPSWLILRPSFIVAKYLATTKCLVKGTDKSQPLPRKNRPGGYAYSRDHSRNRTLSSELWTSRWPLYSMKPNFLNLFMKRLTRGRVVPMISAKVSWLIGVVIG